MQIEKEPYAHYGDCYKLSNGTVEVYVTLDLGPRIICYRFVDGTNILGELGPDTVVKTELGEWRPWGGHRLWHAPESMPRSYVPDNEPVKAEMIGKSSIRVAPAFEKATGIKKEMYVHLDKEGTAVTITHTLKNKGLWPVELAPWALTIMNGGGQTICPQEPFMKHTENLLPARPLVLWHYTNMSDPRWTWGEKYFRLQCDAGIAEPQKVGVANKQGWAGYLREKTLFIKRFPYLEGSKYPDYGCNFETYTAGNFIEVETVGALTTLQPGETATHVEHWYLFDNVEVGDDERSLDAALAPLVKKTAKEQ